MNISVDPASPVPPYEQLRHQIATMIRTDVLRAGTRLPSIRQLAGDLGLANGTVARAYRELEAQGLIQSRVRHGTTVAPTPAMAPAEQQRRLADAARAYVLAARQLGADPQTALDEVLHTFQL